MFAFLALFLLLYHGFSVFYIDLPLPAKNPANFAPGHLAGDQTVTKLSSLVMYAVKEENPLPILKTQVPLLQNPDFSTGSEWIRAKEGRLGSQISRVLSMGDKSSKFSAEVKEFLRNSNCKSRFFMTWISTVDLFGSRELLCIESLFRSHKNACLLIVSNSLDSRKGLEILSPFRDKGFKLIVIKPDFDYLFKNTPAESWFNQLSKGNVDPGEVSLGQNLSNLLRLSLLYKFGGIYIDTDVIVLKNFSKLRNVIGAQTIDLETKNWSRLNNAVMIFDKHHHLLYKFIQEFALTFNGNKWGHNGPYLVSRVVARISGRPGYNFTVMPPPVFYPVYWSRITSLFEGPRNEEHSKWLYNKLEHIRNQSFAVHLWNSQSKNLTVQEGSVLGRIMSDCCIFCSSSQTNL